MDEIWIVRKAVILKKYSKTSYRLLGLKININLCFFAQFRLYFLFIIPKVHIALLLEIFHYEQWLNFYQWAISSVFSIICVARNNDSSAEC